ncbi:MAG: N(4)-(beta-N-acetylglucosaminyl)-L-asparaginase [Gemmatimonadetes bacterium]|nr:N(4)-(beta-N-acetylglucosaminyl)-L-asparaginase [Gemmatimonadota bacterium]
MAKLSRRLFVRSVGALAGVGAIAPSVFGRHAGTGAVDRRTAGPLILDGAAIEPAVVSSGNGLRATETALQAIRDGLGTLEGVVSGVNRVEEDPEDQTVGYGGFPNALGTVQLDSQVYHGPTRGVGAVASLEGYVNPSRVALAVMRYTDHVILVGRGAARFAADMGFEKMDLLTAESREVWLSWRARLSDQDDYLVPEESGETISDFSDPGGPAQGAPGETLGALDSYDGVRPMGTIHCSAVDTAGNLSAVTTTSGLFFKIPGRVGDSPLPGCGCYCDNDVGAAGSTGRGEAVIKTVGSHLIVEEMRRGAHPTDACLTALQRIVDWTVESRLLDDTGRPNFNVNYYAVNKRGETGGAAIWSGRRHSVNDGRGNRLLDSAYLFERA